MAGSRRKVTNTKRSGNTRGSNASLSATFNKAAKTTKSAVKENKTGISSANKQSKTTANKTNTYKGNTNNRRQVTAQTQQKAQQNGRDFMDRMKNLTEGNVKTIAGSHQTTFHSLRNPYEQQYIAAEKKREPETMKGPYQKGLYQQLVEKERTGMQETRAKNLEKASKKIDEGTKQIEREKASMGKGGKFAADLYGAGLGLASDAAAGPLSTVSLLSRSFGSSYKSAKDEGANDSQAALYGAAAGGLEAASEKLFAIATPLKKIYGAGAGDEVFEKLIDKVANKAKSKGLNDLTYHGGKTLASAITEGLEEMVVEGLDPFVANAIYAQAVGNPHEFSWEDVGRAGLLGAAMGGVLGAGGQIVDYRNNQNIMDIYGEEGLKETAKKVSQSDEDLNVKAMGDFVQQAINSGESVGARYAGELMKAEQEQAKRDAERADLAMTTANNMIRDENLVSPTAINENGELMLSRNTQATYDETVAKATEVGKDMQLPELTVNQIAEAVGRIKAGIAGRNDVNLFTTDNKDARTIYNTIMNETLPGKNQEVRDYLYEKIGQNRHLTAQVETADRIDRTKGMLVQNLATEYESEGQKLFAKTFEGVDTRDVESVNDTAIVFDNFYRGARNGLSYEQIEALKHPAYEGVGEEVKRSAFSAGQIDIRNARDYAKGMQMTIGQTAKKNRSKGNRTGSKGRLISEISPEMRTEFSASQQVMYRKLAQVFNINIHIMDELVSDGNRVNGFYQNDEVWLSLSGDRALEYIFAHEITHHMQKYAPEEYNKLKELVRQRWAQKGGINEAIDAKISHYALAGQTLSVEEALDEIIADSTYEMLQDEGFVNELCRNNRGIAEAILDAIRKVLEKIRAVLVDGESFTPKQNAELLSELDILKDAEKLWIDGLMKAAQNRDAVGMVNNLSVQYSQHDDSTIREQITDSLDVLNAMEPVANIKYESIAHLSRSQKADLIFEEFNKQFKGGLERKGFGYIVLRYDEITSSLKYLHKDGEYAAFFTIPKVLKRGIIIKKKVDHKSKVENTVTIAAPVIINGTRGNVGAIVKLGGKKRYHVHRILMPDGSVFKFEDKKTEPNGVDMITNNGEQGPTISSALNKSITHSSQNSKSRKSLMDIDYMKAVESGDMETAQRMVDEAAEQTMKNSAIRDKNGKLLKVYHGTEAEFNSFNDPRHTPNGEAGAFFFSPWKSKSEQYGDNVRAFYLNIERPRLVDYDFNELNPNEEEVDGEIYTPEDLKEEIEQSKQGDAEIIAYYPDQIKSADPVTYDDNGNVIPLSERFNFKSDDIRYSFSSIASSFFEDPDMPVNRFEQLSYQETQGYKNYVEECLKNYEQTRPNMSKEEAKAEIESQIAGIVKVAVASKLAGYDIADYVVDNEGKKIDVTNTRDSKGRQLFSSLEPNSDYFTSNDISTICDKRKNFAEIYDEIVRREEAQNVPKGKRFFNNVNNYFYIHKVLADMGLTQPCKQCFVESMRKNLAPMASAFIDLISETDSNNKSNAQLYHQKGKKKGELKENNFKLRERVLEQLAEYQMTAEELTTEVLSTEDGLAQLRIQAPLIYEAFNSFYGQAKPKMPKSATPFRFGELTALLTDHNGKIKQSTVEKIISTGGFRLQSYSDFQIENFVDVLQVIFEAGTLGLTGHAYTKVPAFLDATEGTNLKRNISVFMYKDEGEWKIDRNDSFPYTLDRIYDIVNADESGNTGIIAVSQNEDMSAWIMANDNVGYGIPFHKSGLKMGVVRDTDVKTEDGRIVKGYKNIKDHTRQQIEVWAKTITVGDKVYKAGTKAKDGIDIYKLWDFENKEGLSKKGLIEKNLKAYIDECEQKNYLPKFREYLTSQERGLNNTKVLNNVLKYAKELGHVSEDASIEDISFEYKGYTIPYGYYKFLTDFGLFKPDGTASPQEVLSLKDYNFDKAVEYFENAEELRRNEILQQFSNGSEREYYEKSGYSAGQLADIVEEKRQQAADHIIPKAKFSILDDEYMDAYFEDDEDLMQEIIDKVANEHGYKYKAYHHTENRFTEFDISKARKSMDIQGLYFSADPDAESEYGSLRYDTYLKMENPYIVDSKEKHQAIPFDQTTDNAGVRAKEWLQENGYDGVIRKAEYFGAEADEYIVFEPGQIKSADIMTFDEDEYGEGDVIPPSERFNESNPDIRFSMPDIDNVNDYINMKETEFFEVPPVRDYEKTSASVRTKSVEELQRQVEILQKDKQLTHGKVLNKSSVREQMNILIRTLMSHSEGTTNKTDNKLVKVAVENAERIFKDVREGNIVDASNTAYYAAREIVENLKLVNDEAFQEYKDLRKLLRTTAVTISEEDKANIPDFKEFRRENMGRLRIVNEGGMAVDDLYANLCEVYPELFDSEITHPADQLIAMADARAQMEPYDIMLSAETTEQLIKETAHDLIEISIKGKPWKSWADRKQEAYEEKVKQLKARHVEALRDVRSKMKDKADERVKAEKEKAKNKIEAEKMANARKQAEQKRAQQESKQRKQAEAEKRRHITRIEKDLKWLSDRLLKPTDDKHLPDGYQQAIAQMLMMVDPQTARSKQLEEKYGPSQKRANFLRLKAEYEKIAQSEAEGMIYNEDISNWCEELAKTLDDAGSIAEATVEEMRIIRQLVRAIAHSIKEQNQAFDEELKAGISELATETIHKAKTSRKTGQRGGIPGALGTLLNESMVTPRDFFEGIGGGLLKAFMSIRKGHDKHVNNMTEARTFFAELFGEYANKKKPGSEIEKWRNHKTNETFDLEGGPITMNVAQKMSLYCLLKREQAAGHIYGSGIVVAEASQMNKLKEALGAKKELNYGTTRITMEEAFNIISTLSQAQIEIAEKLQNFLNGPCAEWGNETSMKMYGYKKFTEPNYFPIQSADVYLESNFEGRQTVERIRNFGFTKGTVVNANNPIVIDDIFTVVADHVNKMSMYNAFAAPIADFTRVYNYKTRDEAGLVLESTKDALANTYGKKVGRYINNFIADLQSNTQTRQEGFTRFVNKTLANYKKATIAANVRVALQQPTAIIRAFTLIDPKYFVLKNHTPELIKKAKGEDTDYKDMLEHCPIARWKSWGFSQVDMARDLDDIMMNKEWQRLDLVTMGVYGVLDLYTWSKIWGAVRAETKAKHPEVEVDSEEFYAICNERASEVFDKTQVVDSVIHRSQVMRNTDTMSKVLTSFMAEPTRTYNMVRSEYAVAMDLWAEGKKGEASKKVARASSVYLLNALVCAMAAAVADALRGKDLDDDDEPEDWRELTWDNFMSNANPLNLLPVFKEVTSIWQGWDTSNMALEGIEALVKAEKGIFDKMRGESDKEWSELIRKQAEAMGMVSGVPVKNILREIETWGKMVGLDVFAAEVGSEEEKKLELNLITDGSGFDNFLNHVGINLTEKERLDRNFDGTVKKLNKATKNMTEAEKQEYLWKEITENYTKAIESGNYDILENMSKLLEATGGDYQKFQESVVSKTKTAMKKSIGVDSAATETYREQLKKMGYTDALINQEVVMKSDAATAFQIEACKDSYEGMVETIKTLYDAGLTEAELDVLYYNRTKAIDANDYRTGEFVAPVTGEITSSFGYRNAPTAGASSYHEGLDIGVAANTDVAAADGGKVSSAGYNSGLGYYVKIYHGNGRYTTYAHLNGYYVLKGEAVSKGQTIGLSGSTGVSTGPHLHFAVQENGVYVDPAKYLY